MGLVYGIDFGTSNSAIMVGRPDGRIIPVRNPVESIYDIPTAVCMRSDGNMLVGSIARRMKLQRPAWYRDEFKREIGSSIPVIFPPEKIGDLSEDRSYAVYLLIAEVLRALRKQAEAEVPGEVDLVVITVPASWQGGKREQMHEAAAAAGFDPARVHLVKEPEAAVAYAVREHLGLHERTLLIYDLGGGTFDCALVRGLGQMGFEILGEAGGLDNIGGALFDRMVLDVVRSRFPHETSELLNGPARDSQTLARRLQLRDTCENVKRVLSTEERYDGLLTELGANTEFTLTREELADLIRPMLRETAEECERLLRSLGMDWTDVDGVVPVGGSCRLPMVGEAIARYSARGRASVMRVEDPEMAVVQGAVLHAFSLLKSSARVLESSASDEDLNGSIVGGTGAPGTQAEPGTQDIPVTLEGLPSERIGEPPGQWGALKPETTEKDTSAQDDAPSGRRRSRRIGTSRFPAAGLVFSARNATAMARAWRWHPVSLIIAFLAFSLAAANFFDAVTGTNPAQGVTRAEMTIAAYVLAGASALCFAWVARALNRAIAPLSGMVIVSISITITAIAHYFLRGWLGWTIVTIALFTAFVGWLGGYGLMPQKLSFVEKLRMDRRSISFFYADNGRADISWSDIDEIFESQGTMTAKIAADRFSAISTGRMNADRAELTVKLFSRYDFTDADQMVKALRFYSAGRLHTSTRYPPGS